MSAGWYLVSANVTDGTAFDSYTWNLTVMDLNRMPTVSIDAVEVPSLDEPAPKCYDLHANASDPDGDGLNYTWYWTNDGNTTTVIGYDDPGLVTIKEGNNTYKVVVFDGKNGTASASVLLYQEPLPIDDDVDDDVTLGSISIDSPPNNAEFESGVRVSVHGTVTDIASGTPVNVTLGAKTATTTVAVDGSWAVTIQAPDAEGTYELNATCAEASDNVSIIVKTTGVFDDDVDDDTDDDSGNGAVSPLFVILPIVIFILLIVLIVVIVLIIRRRSQAKQQEAAPAPPPQTQPETPETAVGTENGPTSGPGGQAEDAHAPEQDLGATPGPVEAQGTRATLANGDQARIADATGTPAGHAPETEGSDDAGDSGLDDDQAITQDNPQFDNEAEEEHT